jgi:hypothetical protein
MDRAIHLLTLRLLFVLLYYSLLSVALLETTGTHHHHHHHHHVIPVAHIACKAFSLLERKMIYNAEEEEFKYRVSFLQ